METIQSYRGPLAILAALILPLAVTAALVPFRASVADTAAALFLVALIVAIAVVGDRRSGFLATVSATLWFDFFLTRPYEKFAITQRRDIEIAVSLFVVGLIVTELAARNRRHLEVATEESNYVGLIYRISEFAVSSWSTVDVIERVRTELIDLLFLQACRYEAGSPEGRVRQIRHDGHVILVNHLWGVDRVGLPGPDVSLFVEGQGKVLGRFFLAPTIGQPVSLQRRVVAVALADQVGGVLRPRLRTA
jgi:K+-sensing histidine kinase KdpD